MEEFSKFLDDLPSWITQILLPALFVLALLAKKIFQQCVKKRFADKSRLYHRLLLTFVGAPLTLLIMSAFVALIPAVYDLKDAQEKIVLFVGKCIGFFALFLLVQKLAAYSMQRYMSRNVRLRTYQGIAQAVITIAVYTIFIIVFLETAGISVTPLVASLGIGSAAIALALQNTLKGLFSGFHLAVDQPIRVGDFVKLQTGEEGYVTLIGWRSSRIRMLSGTGVIIPNAILSESIIHNYDLIQNQAAVLVQVSVAYGSDLKKVEKVTMEIGSEIMRTVQGGVPSFAPFIRYHTFADSGVGFTVILQAAHFTDNYLVKHAFIMALHERFEKEGITIPYPTRRIITQTEKGANT